MKRSVRTTLFIAIPVAFAGAVLLYNHLGGREAGPADQPAAQRGGARTIPVEVRIADYLHLDEGQSAMGTLLPSEEVDVASEVAGKVEQIFFAEGAQVKQGQVLVKINDEDLQSQLKRATFERNMLKEKLDRSRILLESDAISREAFDQAETDYNMVEADIQLLRVRIDKTQIKAPFDGVVGFRYVSPGSYIQPGTKIVHLADISHLKVEFYLSERHYTPAMKGSQISFTTENDRRERHATIYAVDPIVDNLTHSVTLRAMYDNADGRIVPGMLIRVVVGRSTSASIQVPTEAVVPEADRKMVWVVRDGKAARREITTGTRTENSIEVTGGLQQGDSVVITGLMQVREGSPLEITNR